MHHNSTPMAGPASRTPAMPLGTGSRCCLQHRALQRQQQLQRDRSLPVTYASSDARAKFAEICRQNWFVGMILLLPMVKMGEAATEVLEATSSRSAGHHGLGYLASSQAEAAVERQHSIKETPQGHAAAPTAVRPAGPAPVTPRSYTTPDPAAQRATLAEQQQLPEVTRHRPKLAMAQTLPGSLMERWALAVAGQPPAAEHQPAKPRSRDGTVGAGTWGAPREQTAAAPGGGRASMKRFVRPGLVDRWAQAQQRRRQQEAQVHMAQTPPDSLMERWALAVAGQPPAADQPPAEVRLRDGTEGAGARGKPREQTAAAPGMGRASMKRFVKPGLVDRWAHAQQRRQQQEAQSRQPAGRPAAPGTTAAEKQATSQRAAAGKPATPEKGVVAPARTLMDRWSLAVHGIKPLPQGESSSKPASGPSAAAEGWGFAGSKAAAWEAPPARPTGVQAKRSVEPGLMERWDSAVQRREAGWPPKHAARPVPVPPPGKQDQNKLPAAASVGKEHQADPQGAARKRPQERSDRYIRDQKPDVVTPTAVPLSSKIQGQAAAGSSSGKAGGDERSGVGPDAVLAGSQAIAAAAAATKAGGTAEPASGGGTGGWSGGGGRSGSGGHGQGGDAGAGGNADSDSLRWKVLLAMLIGLLAVAVILTSEPEGKRQPAKQVWLDVLRREALKAKSALGHAGHAASSALGNIVGFAKPSHAAPLGLPTCQSHYAPNFVVAVKGDTAQSIAHRCYGSSKLWRAILQKNPGIDKDAIRPGTCLKL